MEACKILGAYRYKRKGGHYFKFCYSLNELRLKNRFSNPTQHKVIVNDGLIRDIFPTETTERILIEKQ